MIKSEDDLPQTQARITFKTNRTHKMYGLTTGTLYAACKRSTCPNMRLNGGRAQLKYMPQHDKRSLRTPSVLGTMHSRLLNSPVALAQSISGRTPNIQIKMRNMFLLKRILMNSLQVNDNRSSTPCQVVMLAHFACTQD